MTDRHDVPEWLDKLLRTLHHGPAATRFGQAIAAHPEFVAMREKAEALDIVAAGFVELEVSAEPHSPRCRARNGAGPWHYGDSPADVLKSAHAQEPTDG